MEGVNIETITQKSDVKIISGKFLSFLFLQKILQRHVDSHFATDEENKKKKKDKKSSWVDGATGRTSAKCIGTGSLGVATEGFSAKKSSKGTARKSGHANLAWWHCARAEEFGLLYGICPRKSAGTLQRRMMVSSESSRRLRRAGVRLRQRENLFSARNFDFFDVGVMAGVRHSISSLETSAERLFESPETVEAQVQRVLAKKMDPTTRKMMALVRWNPENV